MTDVEKLRALLPHWIEHNAEHANDFRAWIERLHAAGQAHVAEHLQAAVEKIESANHDLHVALDHLGGAAHDAGHDHAHPHAQDTPA